jgi:hypothetical protein
MAATGKPEHIEPQSQNVQPGEEAAMGPAPEYIRKGYKGSARLGGKVRAISSMLTSQSSPAR